MLKSVTIVSLIFLALLEYRFWFGADSILQVNDLKKNIAAQEKENFTMQQRNQALMEKIKTLKLFPNAIEEQARYELGMIKRGEKFYQVVEPIQ